jgi:two-component system, cell cycle response regulator
MATAALPGIQTLGLLDRIRAIRTEDHQAGREAGSRALESRPRILVVDDSAVARRLVKQTLEGQPYDLIFARTGQQALDLFEHHRPQLVIMDFVLPDLNGVEICRRMRSAFPSSLVYILMLTAKTDKDSLVEGLQAGADDYLSKPFHHGELVARIGAGIRILDLHHQLHAENKTLEKLALTDPLTGLPNRRAVEDWATRELSGATRHGFSFWVIAVDLDRFKKVNDTFGHEAGDEVLKKFAKILKTYSRRSDICGRLGGEEFLIVITHATAKDVERVVERVRSEIEATPFTFKGCSLRVTASFGISGFEANRPQHDFSTLLAQADGALYSAKRLGRNRIEFSGR